MNSPQLAALENERLVQTLVLFAQGVFGNPAIAATAAGITEAAFLDACRDDRVMLRVEAEMVKLRVSGRNAEIKAAQGLDMVVERLVDRIDAAEGDDLSDSALVRTGEFLHRVSGVEQKRGAELKAVSDSKPKARVIIRYDDDPEPPPEDGGFMLVLNLGGTRNGQ
ncbi:MAG: hypothetical protein NT123_22685 [Proteobacteria bacterium]|nr:hypothetical protein [Pseudomonadota bacterium]